MPSAEYELRYLKAGMELLEDYLLASDLYWPIGVRAPAGETPYPRLTLSWMMLAQKKAHARSMTTEQRAELARLDGEMDATRSHWRVAWGKKAAVEFRARLNLWRDYMDEYREDPRANVDRYHYEVSRRVLLDLLATEAENIPPAEVDMLKGLDNLLRVVLIPGDFIWEAELADSFPRDLYWYLYGRLKRNMS